VSDDGSSSIVVIAMLGNALSPRWAKARRRDPTASSLDFSAMNVAVRAGGQSCWALTERGSNAVGRCRDRLTIGSSTMAWEGEHLVVRVDERSAPWGSPIRGTIRLTPAATSDLVVDLDPCGIHTWSPQIPIARVEVELDEPRVRFQGTGYFDMNRGSGALEDTFASWSWSRVTSGERIAVAYDVTMRDGSERARSFTRQRGGELVEGKADGLVELRPTRFGLPRSARSDGSPIEVVKTIEDGPFYARSVVRTTLGGESALGMHETISLDRFRSAWVRFLVPFRMRVEAV
jgi:carotenoid 1,2-hydratase